MQKIDFPEGLILETERFIPAPPAPIDGEVVDDPVEITAMIRRAAIHSREGRVFSYEELSERLAINNVVIPSSRHERDAWFEAEIDGIWHAEVALAKERGTDIPTLVRFAHKHVKYDGIIIPTRQKIETEQNTSIAPATVDASEMSTLQLEAPPREALTAPAIATIVLGLFAYSKSHDHKLQLSEIVEATQHINAATDARAIGRVVREIAENSYLSAYKTGRKKQTKTWYVMHPDTKQEVIDDFEAGTLAAGIEYMFETVD